MSLARAKLVATGIHFALSAILLGGVAWLLFRLWYPWPLWEILDARGLLLIALGVDLVIGPLLTAVVYQPGKPSLKFDLSVIVLLQLAALAFGVYTMAQVRPVYVIATPHRFEVVSAHQLTDKELTDGDAKWRELSWSGPRYIGLREPTPLERMDAVVEALAGNDLHLRPRFYADFDSAWRVLSVRCQDPGDGRCQLIAHYKGGFWNVIVGADGRLMDVLGRDLDGVLNQPLNAPPPPPRQQTLPFLRTPPATPAAEPEATESATADDDTVAPLAD